MAMGRCVECGRDVSSSAKACPGCGRSHPTVTRMQQAVGFLVLLGVGAGIGYWALRPASQSEAAPVVASTQPPAAATPAAQPKPEDTPEDANRFEECRDKLKLAQSLKLLYGFEWQAPAEPRVLVGPTFFNVAIDVKEGLAETVSCFINGGRASHAVPFNLSHWKTGEPIYRFSGGTLRKL